MEVFVRLVELAQEADVIVLWIVLAFLAGALFWHKIGFWLYRRIAGSDSLSRQVLRGLSDESVKRMAQKTAEEIERRKRVLA